MASALVSILAQFQLALLTSLNFRSESDPFRPALPRFNTDLAIQMEFELSQGSTITMGVGLISFHPPYRLALIS